MPEFLSRLDKSPAALCGGARIDKVELQPVVGILLWNPCFTQTLGKDVAMSEVAEIVAQHLDAQLRTDPISAREPVCRLVE